MIQFVLDDLYKTHRDCNKCEISLTRRNFVLGDGNPDSKLMFIGEAPSSEGDKEGKPFAGKGGKLLTTLMENNFGLYRHRDYYVTNICHCRPSLEGKDRVPTKAEVLTCSPITEKIIEYIKPKIIIALGNTVNSFLSGKDFFITKMRGIQYSYKDFIVIPSYHPSFIIRNFGSLYTEYLDYLTNDISQALRLLNGKDVLL